MRGVGVRASSGVSRFCSAPQHLHYHSSANGAANVSPTSMSLRAAHFFRPADGDLGGEKFISRAPIKPQEFSEASLFFLRELLWVFYPVLILNAAQQHRKCEMLKLLATYLQWSI